MVNLAEQIGSTKRDDATVTNPDRLRGATMEPSIILTTIAGIAATFIGFAGVIFAIGRYSQGAWREAERNAVFNLLVPATAALFLALLPLVIATGPPAGPALWRVYNAILVAVHLPLVASAARLALRKQLIEPIPLRFVLIPGGFIAVLANLIVVAGGLTSFTVLTYVAGLAWFLFVSAVQLLMLVFSHTRDS